MADGLTSWLDERSSDDVGVAYGQRQGDRGPGFLGALLLGLVLLWSVGCSQDETVDAPQPEVAETESAQEEKPPLDAAALAPVIREVSEPGVGPTKIVVELAQAVVADSAVGQPAEDGTRLVLEPPVDGVLSFTSPSTLTFTPSQGFTPNTQYTARLEALETRDGVLTPPQQGRWERLFKTPEFRFVGMALDEVSYVNKRAALRLTFSGDVKPLDVARRAKLTVLPQSSPSRLSPKVRFEPGPTPQSALAILSGQAVVAGARIDLELRDGTPNALDDDIVAPGGRARLQLERGEEARVLHAYTAEGGSGFYVQIICTDGAVDSKRYYWDRVN